jgi:hypothetical protein
MTIVIQKTAARLCDMFTTSNGITLGQRNTDYNNQLIIISEKHKLSLGIKM